MPNTCPTRPSRDHPDVKLLAAQEILENVRAWISLTDLNYMDSPEVLAFITLAMQESVDAYGAGRYLDEFLEWPTDTQLVQIFDRAFRRLPFLKTHLVHQWVMENNVRFPAKKGQGVLARIGDVELKVRITDVIRQEAAGYGEPLGRPDKTIRVNAEEVLKVINLGSSRGPGDFPTGGTPVAAKVQERKVA